MMYKELFCNRKKHEIIVLQVSLSLSIFILQKHSSLFVGVRQSLRKIPNEIWGGEFIDLLNDFF